MIRKTKKTVIAAAALSLMLLAGACTPSSSGTESISSTSTEKEASLSSAASSAGNSLPVSEESENQETRVISTVKGDVTVPAQPKRIITDSGLLGNILALGVIPMAIEDYTSTDVAYQDLIADTIVLDKWEPEIIMAEEPDLIITLYEDSYEQLSKFTPTVYVPANDLSIDEEMQFLAEILGKDPAEGTQVVADFNNKVAKAKEKLEAAGLYEKTFSVIRVQGENKIGVRWSNNLGGQILFGALELPHTQGALEEIAAGEDWGNTLSFEALPQYMGDYILVTEYDDNYSLIKDNPIWQSLPAVQAGNIIVASEPYMYLNDIYSWSAQLDLLTDALLALQDKA